MFSILYRENYPAAESTQRPISTADRRLFQIRAPTPPPTKGLIDRMSHSVDPLSRQALRFYSLFPDIVGKLGFTTKDTWFKESYRKRNPPKKKFTDFFENFPEEE